MPEAILLVAAGLAAGFALGFLAASRRSARKAEEAIRLETQLEERGRRVEELGEALARKESAAEAAARERSGVEARLARTVAELEGAREQAREKLKLLEDARARLEETFKVLASESLRANSESFMNLARAKMESLLAEADGNLERRREAIEKLLQPLSETLVRYEGELRAVEKARIEAYSVLGEQVSSLMQAQESLRQETGQLVNALRLPQTRGRWGELTLRRAVELAGMSPHCDFSEQVSVPTDDGGRKRPDMVIHLPGDRQIVVDSKVSLKAYLEAMDAGSEEERREKLKQHARQVRAHMTALASQEYGRQFEKAPELTVLFLPGESFFSAAAEHDATLIEYGMARGVVVATPTTLVALLLALAHGWRQAGVEENARKISEAGREIHERFETLLAHFEKIGSALGRAVRSYNDAVGSFERRLLPSARKMRELGVTGAAELPDLPAVTELPRIPPPTMEEPEEPGSGG